MTNVDLPPTMLDMENPFQSDESFMQFFNEFTSTPNMDLMQKTDKIISDISELKNIQTELRTNSREQNQFHCNLAVVLRKFDERINGIEKHLSKQDENQATIIKLLQNLTGPSNPRHLQRFPPLQRTKFDYYPQVVPKANPPQHSTRLLLSEFEPIATEDIFEQIDFSQKKVNQGKIQIGQWCDEVHVFTTDDAPALITSTAHVSTSIAASQEDNPDPVHLELSEQIQPIDTNVIPPPTDVSFLHPLDNKISDQTDRFTLLKDCHNNPPVLVVTGTPFPPDTIAEFSMICSSEHGSFYSAYEFYGKRTENKQVESRLIGQSQRLELHDLKIQKKCNNKMKVRDTFALQPYPSGDPVPTITYSRKELFEKYHFDSPQLAVRFLRNNQVIFDKILCSNVLSQRLKSKLLHPETLKVTRRDPQGNRIAFDCYNQSQLIYAVEIPESFHCTIDSGLKWLKISLLTADQSSIIYSTDCEYVNVKQKSFELNLIINKKTLDELVNTQCISIHTEDNSMVDTFSPEYFHSILEEYKLNLFQVQIELVHYENYPDGPIQRPEQQCSPWRSEEFREVIGQKRTFEQMVMEEQ